MTKSKLFAAIATLLLVVLCMANNAVAQQEFTVKVQAGKETRITAFGTHRAISPLLWVMWPPEKGAINVRGVKVTGPCYGQGSNRCKKEESNGQGLFYRPSEGFRGTDRLRVYVTWPSIPGVQVDQIITLEVK